MIVEPWYKKTNNMALRREKTQIGLCVSLVWSQSSLTSWGKFGSIGSQWAHNEDFDQTERMPTLILVFARRTLILLVLIWSGVVLDCIDSWSLPSSFLLCHGMAQI